jgi:hypothetical protein
METNQERVGARIDVINEKSEVLQGILISWTDIHQARNLVWDYLDVTMRVLNATPCDHRLLKGSPLGR